MHDPYGQIAGRIMGITPAPDLITSPWTHGEVPSDPGPTAPETVMVSK